MEDRNGKKYACQSCIKGHRASTCKHSDRPQVEVKKKGRPATQCNHCRELRKVKQVHVKCTCQTRTGEGSVTSGCMCEATGECNCCIPRKPASSSTPKKTSANPTPLLHTRPLLPQPFSSPTSLHPKLLPRSYAGLSSSPLLDLVSDLPSANVYSATSSHQAMRAYLTLPNQTASSNLSFPSTNTPTPNVGSTQNLALLGEFPSLCKCADACHCPACPQHGGGHPTSQQHQAMESCPTCLDCTLHTVAMDTGDDRQSIYPSTHNASPPTLSSSIDEVLQRGEYPSLCQCGDACGCPSCPHHPNTGYSAAGESCPTCLDCTLHTMVADAPPDLPGPTITSVSITTPDLFGLNSIVRPGGHPLALGPSDSHRPNSVPVTATPGSCCSRG